MMDSAALPPSAPDPALDASTDSPLDWRDDGLPQSRLYGDVYFSSVDGLAETRAVYLAGCGLPEAWAGRTRFTVGELGFGSGLNIAALLDLWRRHRPAGGHLHIFSIEAHPITRDEAARALGGWPELGEAAQVLIDHWPSAARGFHRIDLPGFDATFDLAVAPVEAALAAWDGAADAWFLDGFSPALNPAMWTAPVMAAVAARSRPGARAATFTVARAVRDHLTAAGFTVEKRPGFGRKRQRLEAWLPGVAPPDPANPRLVIVGGGIAGAALARAAAALGLEARLFDDGGQAASGNPSALVTPALDAGGGPRAALPAQAFGRAVGLYEAQPQALLARGALQLALEPRERERFAAVVAQAIFAPSAMSLAAEDQVAERLSEPGRPALAMGQALVIEPALILEAWAPRREPRAVARLAHTARGWDLLDDQGEVMATAEVVILAGGADLDRLWPRAPLRLVRGQASWTQAAAPPPVAFGGYAIPTRDGVLFGATHDRDDRQTDTRPTDHARNLTSLATALPALADRLRVLALDGRAAIRATTADHLPLAGRLPDSPDGLFVLSGLGGRGFCLAPLLAEHVVARAADRPSPLPRDLSRLVDPARFNSLNRRVGV